MEQSELDLIQELSKSNWELRTLFKSHQQYGEELAGLDRRPVLTPTDELRKKEVRKLKLLGRDRMTAILAEYRRSKRRVRRAGLPDLTT